MSKAELRAHKLFKEYHLNDENFEVKRNLMILLLNTAGFVPVDGNGEVPSKMSYADISERLAAAEKDILSGNVMACEDVHRNIEEKCPWLCK